MEVVEVCILNCGVVLLFEGVILRFLEEETRKENFVCVGVVFELISIDWGFVVWIDEWVVGVLKFMLIGIIKCLNNF